MSRLPDRRPRASRVRPAGSFGDAGLALDYARHHLSGVGDRTVGDSTTASLE